MGPFKIVVYDQASGDRILEVTAERFEHHSHFAGELLIAVRGNPRGLAGKIRRAFRPVGPLVRLLETVKRFTAKGR